MVLRRTLTDGERDILREQEQDARAVEEAAPDPDAMDQAFGSETVPYTDAELIALAKAYYEAHGWPGQEGQP